MARAKMVKLDCGHYSATSECDICRDRAAIEAIQRRAAEQVRPDPPAAVDAPATAAVVVSRMGDTPTPGIYSLPDSVYFTDPLRVYGTESLSGSTARYLIPPSTPAHYRWKADHPNEPTEAMIFGSAVHALTMETADLAVFQGKSWNSKAGAEFLALHDPDGDDAPILETDVPRAKAMALALRSHPIVKKMLAGAQFEQAIFCQEDETGAWLRGKIDILQPLAGRVLVVGDIKTTAGYAHPWEFTREAAKLSYHVSDAHYARILRALTGAKEVRMLYAVVESRPPYLVAIHEIDREDLQRAAELGRLAINRFADALNTGDWGGYPNVINKITLPVYAARNEEDALLAEEGAQ